jgi:hypothetical protein
MHPTERRHRQKRPFQPSITTYFARDDPDLCSSAEDDDLRGLNPTTRPRTHHDHPQATQDIVHKETLAPQVPGHVQSGLLQVGMRVRKNVPEGYKTHNNKMIALPSIQTTMAHPNTTSTSTTTITVDVKASRGPVPEDVLHQRELLPFCGLHKIGGFAEQPTTNIHLYTGSDTSTAGTQPQPDDAFFPLPAEIFSQPFHSSSSQDSGYGSVNANPSKRAWHDEDEPRLDMLNANFLFSKGALVDVEEVPVSPLSATPENMLPAVRRFKQPKSRRQRAAASGDVDMDAARVVAGTASDFEEADFLGTGEVDMGGV